MPKRSRTKKAKRSNRKTIRRRQRGGNTKIHACNMPYPKGFPEAIREGEELSQEKIKLLKDTIKKVPNGSVFVLKIGSNDNPIVASKTAKTYDNVSKYGHSSGSSGKDGVHYYEYAATDDINKDSILYNLKDAPQKLITIIQRDLLKKLKNAKQDGYLLAISPIEPYPGFEYPFLQKTTETLFYAIPELINDYIKESEYLQAFFPLTATGRNREVLDLLVEREEPLVLFNAMASSCYVSMKYVIDLRKRAGKTTYYMGLADVASDALECDINHPIYPNREESCA